MFPLKISPFFFAFLVYVNFPDNDLLKINIYLLANINSASDFREVVFGYGVFVYALKHFVSNSSSPSSFLAFHRAHFKVSTNLYADPFETGWLGRVKFKIHDVFFRKSSVHISCIMFHYLKLIWLRHCIEQISRVGNLLLRFLCVCYICIFLATLYSYPHRLDSRHILLVQCSWYVSWTMGFQSLLIIFMAWKFRRFLKR